MDKNQAREEVKKLRSAGVKWDDIPGQLVTLGYCRPDLKPFSTQSVMNLVTLKGKKAASVKAKEPVALPVKVSPLGAIGDAMRMILDSRALTHDAKLATLRAIIG